MEVVEKYQELVEANADDISVLWKVLPILFYFISAASGYGVAILFYILWQEIFAANCPLWAEIILPNRQRMMPDDVPIQVIPAAVSRDWRRNIFVVFKYKTRCEFYHFVSLLSCLFGIAWMVLFAMCGKGGYDTRIFVAPWRIVPPALIFQFIFTILTMVVVNDLEYGYGRFASNLQEVAVHYNDSQLPVNARKCDIVQNFFEIYGSDKYDVCKIYPVLQALSWIMAFSWFLGLIVLTLRVVSIKDFKLLTVTIHTIPKDEIHKYAHSRVSTASTESVESTKEKRYHSSS